MKAVTWSRLVVISILALGVSQAAVAASTEKLIQIQNGENVGFITAATDRDATTIEYHVDQNGRGPKHRLRARFDTRGMPVEWQITGTSLMGGAVKESYRWASGRATWESQADRGDVAAAVAPLYIVNDDNPWIWGAYARALLATRGNRLDALPGGSLSLTRLRDVKIAAATKSVTTTVYRLDGLRFDPVYLLLDRQRRLFAQFDDQGAVVQAGFESEAAKLRELGRELATELARTQQQQLAHRYPGPWRLRNVRVLDPVSGSLGSPSTVIVMRDRISGVLPLAEDQGARAGETVIDGEGGVLMPGLHDMHAHTTLLTGLFYLAAGVTTTRDQGNFNDFLQPYLSQWQAGVVASPRIVPSGFIEGRSPFSARLGQIPETREDALRVVDWYADRGYRQLKIYNSMTPGWVAMLASAAHARGMKVSGHVPAFMSPDQAITDGYDDIAHINQLMLGWLLEPNEDTRTPLRLTAMARGATLDLASPRVRKTVDLMKSHGTALDTTAVILERLMLSRAGMVMDGDRDIIDHVPVSYQRMRKRTYVPLTSASEDQTYHDGVTKILEVLKLLHDNGIQLLPGTDDATGFTVHREIELYVQAGIAPAAALRLATLDAARYLGLDRETGTIERGKFADFVLLGDDPLRDIRAIKRARMVVSNGVVYYPNEIYDTLGIKPFATAPRVRQ